VEATRAGAIAKVDKIMQDLNEIEHRLELLAVGMTKNVLDPEDDINRRLDSFEERLAQAHLELNALENLIFFIEGHG